MQGARTLLVALVAAAAALPAASASADSCANLDVPISAGTVGQAKDTLVCMVNAERSVRGLPPLAVNDKLGLAAQRHTDDMVARNYFSHEAPAPAPNGTDPGARITAAGYSWTQYGENIAAGYDTPRQVMLGWMASEGHCTNILEPGVTQIGIGIAPVAATLPNQAGGTWTQDFGRAMGTRAPSSDTGPQHSCPYDSLLGLTAPALPAPAAPSDPTQNSTPITTVPQATTASPAAPNSTPVPAPSVAAPHASLRVSLRHHGRRLVVAVALPAAADGARVRIVVRHRHRMVRWVRTHVLHGHVRARVRLPRHLHRMTIVVSSGHWRLVHAIR